MTEPKDSNVSALIQKRSRVKGSLTRLRTFAEGIHDSHTIVEINLRLAKIEEAWKEFIEIEDALLLNPNQSSELEEFEAKYYETKALLLQASSLRLTPTNSTVNQSGLNMNNSTDNTQNQISVANEQLTSAMATFLSAQEDFLGRFNQSNLPGSSNAVRAQLPRLQIPEFSGNFTEWPSFSDLFTNTVDKNESLTDCQRLQYLKGLLKGEAASIIRHLNITESNYKEAWDKLKARYDKRRHITTAMIKTFLDVHPISQPAVRQLRNVYDIYDEVIRGLRALGNEAEKRDAWLILLALNKLDSETKQLWFKESCEKDFPSFDEFLMFLNNRCDALETCDTFSSKTHSTKVCHYTSSGQRNSCPLCTQLHFLFQCPEFKAISTEQRKRFIIENSMCFNCLQAGHTIKSCHSQHRCFHCKKMHHSLLHGAADSQPTHSSTTKDPGYKTISSHTTQLPSQMIPCDSSNKTSKDFSVKSDKNHQTNSSMPYFTTDHFASFNSCLQLREEALGSYTNPASPLPTAVVHVKDGHGRNQTCRILLDSGSQISFVSENCIQRLLLKRKHARVAVTGVGSSKAGFTRGKVNLTLQSQFDDMASTTIDAYILARLTSSLPPVATNTWQSLEGRQLADPHIHVPTPIDIVVGADKFFDVLKEGTLRNGDSSPLAQNTIFGWVLCGPQSARSHVASLHANIFMNIDEDLKGFWEDEELNIEQSWLTEEETSGQQTVKVEGAYESDNAEKLERQSSGENPVNARLSRSKSKSMEKVNVNEEGREFTERSKTSSKPKGKPRSPRQTSRNRAPIVRSNEKLIDRYRDRWRTRSKRYPPDKRQRLTSHDRRVADKRRTTSISKRRQNPSVRERNVKRTSRSPLHKMSPNASNANGHSHGGSIQRVTKVQQKPLTPASATRGQKSIRRCSLERSRGNLTSGDRDYQRNSSRKKGLNSKRKKMKETRCKMNYNKEIQHLKDMSALRRKM